MYTAAVLNPSEYHDIYEEVALTGSWDQETRTKAQGLLTPVSLRHVPSSHSSPPRMFWRMTGPRSPSFKRGIQTYTV